jgi:hypothetical protein
MSLNIPLRSSFVRRLLLLSFVFVASSCGSNSGFSCHHGSDGISVSVGSNLDASGVHHSVVGNSTDDSPDQSPAPGDIPDSSDVSEISPDDSPDQSPAPSLDLPDPEVASGESSDFPATYFVIWNGKSYEPSDCITVMWGRLCLSAK